jgi:PAS domain-containing protein
MLIGRSMGLAEQELVDLGSGALMHDVGKLDVPDRFRHQEEGFSSNELNAYRDHVAKGVTLGQRMGLAAGSLMVLAQHHEHADGSGFPLRLAGERISMAARIVAIVNRYDNLCNPQSRVIPLTPHEAVSVLFAQGRNRFDAAVLNAFIRMMGVYPAGSLVQLTDDRFAMVVGVNSSRPLKPRVLVHDAHVPRSEALMLDLEQQPDLGIRRSLVAAKLPLAGAGLPGPAAPRFVLLRTAGAKATRRGAGMTEAGTGAWAALLEGLPHAAWVVAWPTQRVVAANAAAAELFNRPIDDLIGEPALALAVSPEDLAYWDAAPGRPARCSPTCCWPCRRAAACRPAAASGHCPGGSDGAPTHALVLLVDQSANGAWRTSAKACWPSCRPRWKPPPTASW